MTTRHYDAVVVGGRLSASILGALLGKRGLRGLLIDQGELASVDGRLLPDLVMSEQGSLAMELVHSELGVREDLKVRTQALVPPMQAVFPDQRIDLFAQRPALLAELRRAFGAASDGFERMLARIDELEAGAGEFLATAGELPATGFFARRTAASAARKHSDLGRSLEDAQLLAGLRDELAEILLAPLPFLTHLDGKRPNEVSVARFARTIGRFLRGLSALDDRTGLRELFLDIARRKGFEVRKSAIETVEPKGKELHIHVVGHRDDLITTEVLVDCSADLSGLDTIPHKQQSKDMALMLQSAKPRGFLHAVSIELDRDVIPPGMADHLILLNGRKDPTRFDANDPDAEDRPILLSIRGPGATPDRVQLVAAHPVSSVRARAEWVNELDDVMRHRVQRLIPFLAEGHPVVQPLSNRGSGRDARSVPAHPLFATDLDQLAGITGVPMRTSFKNVFVAGPAVLPGLGIEGEYLSALQAADACESFARGAKKPKTLAGRVPSVAGGA